MQYFKESATVLLNGHRLELSGFKKYECYGYVSVDERWAPSNRIGYSHLFGIRFINGKLELLFDERRRRCSDPQIWAVCECCPADEASSRVLREMFETITCKRSGNAPLEWPW